MRSGLLAAVLLLAGGAFAGCISSEDDVKGPDDVADLPVDLWILDKAQQAVDPSLFPGGLPDFQVLKVADRVSGEPTLGVTRGGAVFYAAIDWDGFPDGNPLTHYMRSTDGGLTWENRSPQIAGVSTHPNTADPYVYVDPTTGRVFAMDMGPNIACNKVSWSDDDGETWMTREGACIPGANDHPTLFAGPATTLTNTLVYPNQVYLCTNQVTDTLCYQSPDGGLDWIATQPAYIGYDPLREQGDLEGLCGGLSGHGHASFADGAVYLGRSYCGAATVAVSHDGGVTWSVKQISSQPEQAPYDHDVSIGTDTAGNAYALWVGNAGDGNGARSVYLAKSTDSGETWSEPINVTAPGVTAVKLPSLVAGSQGRIAFLYVGTDTPLGWAVDDQECVTTPATIPIVTSGTRTCEWLHQDDLNNTTWNAYIGMSLDADTDDPVIVTQTANQLSDPVKRGPCGGRCMGTEGASDGGMYDFLDIDIDPVTGEIWAALVDVCSGECDGEGKSWDGIKEHSVGAVAKLVAGPRLLVEPLPEA